MAKSGVKRGGSGCGCAVFVLFVLLILAGILSLLVSRYFAEKAADQEQAPPPKVEEIKDAPTQVKEDPVLVPAEKEK